MKKKITPPEPDLAQLAHVKAQYDPKKKLAVASTDAVDRHGEIIDQDGWDLKNFLANPVMLWAHDNYEPAVGNATNLQITTMADGKKALTFTPVFHGKTELSKAMDALYNGDPDTNMKPMLNSFSVGFRPTEMQGNVFTEQELLEISCVNVPANADARVLAYKSLVKRGIPDKIAKDVMQIKGAVSDELELEAMWEAKRQNMSDIRDIYWAFCDVYFDEDTAVDDFGTLVLEVADLFTQVANGTFVDPVDDVVEESQKVLDRVRINRKDGGDSGQSTKGKTQPAPKPKALSQRQMLTKAIVRAADKIGSSKSQSLLTPDQQTQVKLIKRAADKLSASHKEEIKRHG